MDGVDPDMLHGWLTARSQARNVPVPVADHGGWRVDTGSPTEVCRYVFASPGAGLAALGTEVEAPRIFLKLCTDRETLMGMVPVRWQIVDESWVMTGMAAMPAPVPAGYRVERDVAADALHIRIVTDAGDLAASGHGAVALGVFAYDRIVTEPAHRRRGLGRVLMTTLAEHAPPATTHMLVATEMGRGLYGSLGWRTLAPFATAVIPG